MLKIAITGPESTGKSILAEQLAGYYHTTWVPEFARTYIEQLDRPYTQEDILLIAKGQLESEFRSEQSARGVLFCDTELIVTKIWSEVKYQHCDPWILKMIEDKPYDLYLLCDIDIPWAFDPQREHPHYRKELFELYLNELSERKLNFRIVSGLGASRLENAVQFVKELIND